jgi:4-hydroxy-3-methylbut-2-enyl diphosphate reductase
VVDSPEEVERLPFDQKTKLAFVTQTTLSVSDAMRVIDALKKRYPNIRHPQKDDICYATTNRQNAVSDIAPEVDVVLVVGSQNSSNSQRLVDRARDAGRPGYLIDDESELKPEWFEGVDSVLITAGASAPDHLVRNLIERLQRDYGGEVETRTLVQEGTTFELPKSLRQLTVVN